jgi:hypothetical protein
METKKRRKMKKVSNLKGKIETKQSCGAKFRKK